MLGLLADWLTLLMLEQQECWQYFQREKSPVLSCVIKYSPTMFSSFSFVRRVVNDHLHSTSFWTCSYLQSTLDDATILDVMT